MVLPPLPLAIVEAGAEALRFELEAFDVDAAAIVCVCVCASWWMVEVVRTDLEVGEEVQEERLEAAARTNFPKSWKI